MTARNPTTFIVGAGPVATAVAGALRKGGVPVLGLWARRAASARQAAATAGVAAFSSAPPDVLLEAEVVILAVRDQVIGEVAQMLLGTGLVGRRHVLLHCSGAAAAADVLGGAAPQVGGVGTLHPLVAIADGRAGIARLPGSVFGVEGDERGRQVAVQLVGAIGGSVLSLASSQMATYHAAAALASNYLVAAVDAAASALVAAGIPEDQATAALLPLAEGALRNVAAHGAARGLTGPVRRGDAATVERHLDALRAQPEIAALYRALARRTADLAGRLEGADAPPADGLAAIRALLGG